MPRLGLAFLAYTLVIGASGSASAGQARDEAACASPKFYSHFEWRDSLPRRLARPGYPFTLERQESIPEERPRGIPVYIKDGGMRTFSRR